MRYRLTSHRCAIHDFELCDCLTLVVLIRNRTGRLTPDNGEFHMLDLDSNKQEINLANNHIFQVISCMCGPESVISHESRTERRRTSICYTRIRCVGSPQSQPPSLLSCSCPAACDTSAPKCPCLSQLPLSAARLLLAQNIYRVRYISEG